MKNKLILIALIGMAAFCAVTSPAQTNQVPNLITNASPDIIGDIKSGLSDITSGTNWTVAVGGGLSTDGKNGVAYGVIAYDFSENVGVIVGEDVLFNHSGHQWNSVKGGITLKTQIYPLKWTGVSWLENIQGRPYVADLIASGHGGSSVGNIVSTGMDFQIYAFKNFAIGIGAEYDNRTGQGIYDGNYISGHADLSRTF